VGLPGAGSGSGPGPGRDPSRARADGTAVPGDPTGLLDLPRDGLGPGLSEEQTTADFDTLPGGDPVGLPCPVMPPVCETGRALPVGPVPRARGMRGIHGLVVTGERTDSR
jgi:hypothetical protein